MENVVCLKEWREKKLREEIEKLSKELDEYMRDVQIDVFIFDSNYTPVPIGKINRSELW